VRTPASVGSSVAQTAQSMTSTQDLEAEFLMALSPASVLYVGCGTDQVMIELHSSGVDVMAIDFDRDATRAQLDRRFDIVLLTSETLLNASVGDRRAIMHTCAQHLLPAGALVAGLTLFRSPDALSLDHYDALCADCDLRLVERWADWARSPHDGAEFIVSVHRRSTRFNVHDLVFAARAGINRIEPHDLAARLAEPNPPLVVDTRRSSDRMRFGVIENSIHVPRTVVEWHLDPANGYRHPAVRSFDQPVVIVCTGGYSSSLSAANLARIGFSDVADLIGGMTAWRAAGLPVTSPSHCPHEF